MKYYTNVAVYGGRILYRGVDQGIRSRTRLDYFPTLYLDSPVPTNFTTVTGKYVRDIQPGNIKDCREFVERYKDVSNFTIYGNQKYEYAFIGDEHPTEIEWDRSGIVVCNIDIEVGSENGFPEPEQANEPVTAITYKKGNHVYVYGCGDFKNTRADVTYLKCVNEQQLLTSFVEAWSADYPDLVTGWNTRFFDIPYLVNRITRVLGYDMAKRLSPWNVINERRVFVMNNEKITFSILGVASLDYLELYMKFAPKGKSQESYKLGDIAHEELKDKKISYEEYGNLHGLYKRNYQLFIEYNIKDVELVDRLDDKLKLIDLALTLAYDNRVNYEDVLFQVRMWDAIIYNELKSRNIVVPPVTRNEKNESFEGAYVKDPIIGMHNWVASFDLNSLYPHLIIQYNISPDTIIEPYNYTPEMNTVLAQDINVETLLHKQVDTTPLKTAGATLTPNGQLFRLDKTGFLPKLMSDMYKGRSAYKKKAIEAKKELEKETDPDKRKEIEKRISRYDNLQLAKKVSLNSAYGATGNEFFRFYDIRQAAGITTAGQLSIRWIEKKLNEYLNKLLGSVGKDYVIASDTDSIYLALDALVSSTIKVQAPTSDTKQIIAFMDRVCETKIQPFIDKSYSELAGYINAADQKMIMKREALADKGIWTAKKRYILNVYNNEGIEYAKPEIKIMGLEVVRSSTPTSVRKKLKDAIEVIITKDEASTVKFIADYRKEFKTLPLPDIAFPRGVNGIAKYHTPDIKKFKHHTPFHTRGAIIYNHLIEAMQLGKKYEKIKDGDKIKFVYLNEPNMTRNNVIAFPMNVPEEFGLEKFIDYDQQFDKAFLEPIKKILDAIGWSDKRRTKLSDMYEDD